MHGERAAVDEEDDQSDGEKAPHAREPKKEGPPSPGHNATSTDCRLVRESPAFPSAGAPPPHLKFGRAVTETIIAPLASFAGLNVQLGLRPRFGGISLRLRAVSMHPKLHTRQFHGGAGLYVLH